MPRLRIKNFGPIKEGFIDETGNEWMDIRKVTGFIGNQGTGKSTVAKVIATMMWLEKSLNIGDIEPPENLVGFMAHFEYQGLRNYFREDTLIQYEGDAFYFKFDRNTQFPIVMRMEGQQYKVPKVMYVPAERSFLSTIRNVYNITGLPAPLFTFAEEMRRIQSGLTNKEGHYLPVSGYKYLYNPDNDQAYLLGDDHTINITEASSGLQSLVPLYLVSSDLAVATVKGDRLPSKQLNVNRSLRLNREIAEVMLRGDLTSDEKVNFVESIKGRYESDYFVNIVEEPEQNLFPKSQWEILQSLLLLNNMNQNILILTTHSPYLVNFLSIAVEAGALYRKIQSASPDRFILYQDTENIVPMTSAIWDGQLAIYQMAEDGTIRLLPNVEGIPSDRNYLNDSLAEGNHLFDALLEIEAQL